MHSKADQEAERLSNANLPLRMVKTGLVVSMSQGRRIVAQEGTRAAELRLSRFEQARQQGRTGDAETLRIRDRKGR